jgi:chromate transporter
MWKILWELFWVFTRVSIFSWGGGPSSLALMQREVVAYGWITPAEFADGMGVSNALPGPITPKLSAFVGYKVAGMAGAAAAVAGTVIPATVLMLVIIIYFFQLKDSPSVRAMLTAVRPMVVGLLLWTAYDVARSVFSAGEIGWARALEQDLDKLGIVLVTFLLLAFTKINPVLVVMGAAALGFFVYR